jgi:hypothetical protein
MALQVQLPKAELTIVGDGVSTDLEVDTRLLPELAGRLPDVVLSVSRVSGEQGVTAYSLHGHELSVSFDVIPAGEKVVFDFTFGWDGS